ncbi:MAG: DsbA family protein [Alphaproteobacteria bacterium]|nr:DsbA family protein [Alphaproteobacteria bacterium]
MPIKRRHFIATAGSLGLLTLAACSSDPVDIAESAGTTDATPAPTPAADTPAGAVELYDGGQVEPLGSEALLNPVGLKDRPIGGKGAKVVVIEYSSPTCPHCADFAAEVFPEFRKTYIDTGKVTFVFRPFARNVLDAVVFLLAEAAGKDKYFEVLDAYFRTANAWAVAEKPRDELEKIALQLGFSQESFEAALTNQDLFAGLESLRQQALDEFDVTGTPTFFINGNKIVGAPTLDRLAADIDPLLG